MTPIVLCSDDYAQSEGVDAAILELLRMQRLTAVSCMSNAPRWLTQAAPALRDSSAAGQADIGLHFNLTEGFGATAPFSLSPLILRSFAGALSRRWLARTLHAQLDAFEQGMGRAPDFIDGHQHVHQLPGVRTVLMQALRERYADAPLWIRNTVPADAEWAGKPKILRWLGGASLARALGGDARKTNNGFAGVYGFNRPDYEVCFAEWLRAATPGMLIMCHPATQMHAGDAIAAQRLVEYEFLRSPAFAEALDKAQVRLARLSALT